MYVGFVSCKFIKFISSVNLKLKLPVILPAKWVYLGIAETCNPAQASYGHITGQCKKERRETLFLGKVGEVGRVVLKESPLEKSRASGDGGFSHAELQGGWISWRR